MLSLDPIMPITGTPRVPQAVTITLTRYAEPDALVAEAIRHAVAQQGVTGEVLFIEQNMAGGITEQAFADAPLAFRMIRAQLGGLSEARNLAMDHAAHSLILFLDADAMAAPDWAARLAETLADNPRVAVAGSRIVPGWPGKPPLWAKARVVNDQYSMLDLGSGTFPYHRVVGAGFAVDMARLPPHMRFDPTLGRREGKLFSGEESEFCARVRAAGLEVVYDGRACVTHVVPPERTRLPWIARRLFYAGHGRAVLGGTPAPSQRPGLADWLTLPLTLPPYALGWLKGKLLG
ncbi:glycosyltransferase [Altererythrobacter sp. FM1]|uniref:glycosyltransferase family 2 protein n=1 Tax=Tsuneonella flava TaxID=2055955 RepID=UPI000C800B1E|nr:glycosyltransferase [Tsuneonella flava]ROT93304.1 glycosyltransferase [Altererythrobacter sp. FM1]